MKRDPSLLKKYIDDLVHQRSELGKITKALRNQAKGI